MYWQHKRRLYLLLFLLVTFTLLSLLPAGISSTPYAYFPVIFIGPFLIYEMTGLLLKGHISKNSRLTIYLVFGVGILLPDLILRGFILNTNSFTFYYWIKYPLLIMAMEMACRSAIIINKTRKSYFFNLIPFSVN